MPAPKVDRALVLHVAKLASLSLAGAEADRFAEELGRVIGYVELLGELDTGDVGPPALVLEGIPLREDELKPGLSHEDALAQAPCVERGGFAVPTFVE